MELPIYLIGYMGAGKTTAGKLLADKLGWHFVDLDNAFHEIHGYSTPSPPPMPTPFPKPSSTTTVPSDGKKTTRRRNLIKN